MVIASVLKEIKDKMRRKGCLVYLKAGRESMIEFPDGSKLRLDGDGFSLDGQILSIDIDEQPIDVFVSLYDICCDQLIDNQKPHFIMLMVGIILNLMLNQFVIGCHALTCLFIISIIAAMVVVCKTYIVISAYKILGKICLL